MNRDATIIQIAVLMVAIGVLGIAIYRQQNTSQEERPFFVTQEDQQDTFLPEEETPLVETPTLDELEDAPKNTSTTLTEKVDSPLTNLVKQYFAHMEAKEFKEACALMSSGKCAASRPSAVEAFSQEYQKYTNGYEYLAVKDLWIQAPSGKDVVCVKYAYRYKGDTNPGLITEIMSYYIEEDVGKYVISDRVCEKKYKEGSGVRPCPIEARQNFCVGQIK